MRIKFGVMAILFFLMAGKPSMAEYFQYTDENGNVRFTDDKSTIPETHLQNTTSHNSAAGGSGQKTLTEQINHYTQKMSKEDMNEASMQYFLQGSKAYIDKDYHKAIDIYSKSLNLYKQIPLLNDDFYLLLILYFGRSYRLIGDNDNAIEIFGHKPNNPIIAYNLACIYAERNDFKSVMRPLQEAYRPQNPLIYGEELPSSPDADPSFSKLLNNEEFIELLANMKRYGKIK